MSSSKSLDSRLNAVRANSIKLRNEREMLRKIVSPTKSQEARLEQLRVEINKSRKEERFLSGRIKLLSIA